MAALKIVVTIEDNCIVLQRYRKDGTRASDVVYTLEYIQTFLRIWEPSDVGGEANLRDIHSAIELLKGN